jgi:hypothetical protein
MMVMMKRGVVAMLMMMGENYQASHQSMQQHAH